MLMEVVNGEGADAGIDGCADEGADDDFEDVVDDFEDVVDDLEDVVDDRVVVRIVVGVDVDVELLAGDELELETALEDPAGAPDPCGALMMVGA
jgi:hypothetical protein